MQLQITIPDDQVERLRRLAEHRGFPTVEEYVASTIVDRVDAPAPAANVDPMVDWKTPPELLTSEQWRERFKDIVRRQTSRNPDFDDSRDSIYD